MPTIKLTDDAEAKVRRASRKLKNPLVVAVCLWCGHGYAVYNSKKEGEHFAVCPNAPPELKANAKKRLG